MGLQLLCHRVALWIHHQHPVLQQTVTLTSDTTTAHPDLSRRGHVAVCQPSAMTRPDPTKISNVAVPMWLISPVPWLESYRLLLRCLSGRFSWTRVCGCWCSRDTVRPSQRSLSTADLAGGTHTHRHRIRKQVFEFRNVFLFMTCWGQRLHTDLWEHDEATEATLNAAQVVRKRHPSLGCPALLQLHDAVTTACNTQQVSWEFRSILYVWRGLVHLNQGALTTPINILTAPQCTLMDLYGSQTITAEVELSLHFQTGGVPLQNGPVTAAGVCLLTGKKREAWLNPVQCWDGPAEETSLYLSGCSPESTVSPVTSCLCSVSCLLQDMLWVSMM